MHEQGEFSVYWWDPENRQVTEMRYVSAQEVERAVSRLTGGPAARMGFVNRVMVTDGGDCSVFEWTKSAGQVWPRKEIANVSS